MSVPLIRLCVPLLVVLFAVLVAAKHNKDKYDGPSSSASASSLPQALSALLQQPQNQSGAAAVYYDQRQTGKYNINVNIKDVAIISIDPEQLGGNVGDVSGDGDYYEDYYDYNLDDFTVSPIAALLGGMTSKKPPTAKPTPAASPSTPVTAAQNGSTAAISAATAADVATSSESTLLTASPASPASASANGTATEEQPIEEHDQMSAPLPQLQENEIPVHVVMDGEQLPQQFGAGGHRRWSGQQQKQHQKRRRYSPGRRNAVPRTCVDDESGRCQQQKQQAASSGHGRQRGRRVGMQKVMDLLTLLAPKDNDSDE